MATVNKVRQLLQGIVKEGLSRSDSRNTKDKADGFKSREPSRPEAHALVVTREPPRLLQGAERKASFTQGPCD